MAQSSLVERPSSFSGHLSHSQRDNVDDVFGPRAPPSRSSIPSEWWDGNGNCVSSDATEDNPPLAPNLNQQDPILPSWNLELAAVLGLDEPQVTPFLRRKLNSQIQDNAGMYPPGLGSFIRLNSEVSDRSDSSEENNALLPAVSTSRFQEELTEASYVQGDKNSYNNNHGNAEPNRNPFRNHQEDNPVTPLPSNVQNNATLEAESLVNFLNYILRCLNNPTQVREVFHEHIEPFTRMICILEQQCAYLGPTGFMERLTSQDDVFLRLWDSHIVFMKPWIEIVAAPIPLVNPNIVDWQVIQNMTRSLRVRAQTLCKTVTVPVDFTRYFEFWEQHYQLLEHYHDSVIRCIKDFAPNTTNSTQASSARPNVAYRSRQAANLGRDVINSSQSFSPGSEYSNDSSLQGTHAEYSGKPVEKGNYKGKEKEQNLSDTSSRTFREPLVSTYNDPAVASTSGSSLRPEDVVKEPESSNNAEVVDIFSYEQTYDALLPEDPMYDAFGGEPNWNLPIIGEGACVPIVQGSLPHP
ncbi:hypothetical protein BDQ12DRAFT_685532 [Crucibulum laeve]|uniref:Uncharacterized protein n=1 Tax=Crucibulum laeve TaxID=68775 RepID=A0A5C3LW55_9AGAR|nr:hypothetical protein BDQ12DRAFT_685532 [Crucibulum laeve]